MRRALSRWVMRRATRLVTNSRYSQAEIERNIGFPAERVRVIHHGVPDPYGRLPEGGREHLALSVGLVTRENLEIKGQRAFVAAAAHAPDVRFVLAGPWRDGAIDELRRDAAGNVEFTGWLEREDLDALFRRAAVYVQPSRHEGSGWRWPRRCWPVACRWSPRRARCPRWWATRVWCWTATIRVTWPRACGRRSTSDLEGARQRARARPARVPGGRATRRAVGAGGGAGPRLVALARHDRRACPRHAAVPQAQGQQAEELARVVGAALGVGVEQAAVTATGSSSEAHSSPSPSSTSSASGRSSRAQPAVDRRDPAQLAPVDDLAGQQPDSMASLCSDLPAGDARAGRGGPTRPPPPGRGPGRGRAAPPMRPSTSCRRSSAARRAATGGCPRTASAPAGRGPPPVSAGARPRPVQARPRGGRRAANSGRYSCGLVSSPTSR